jgi:hypothetical protein
VRRGISATENHAGQTLDRARSAESSRLTSIEAFVVWELSSKETSATVTCLIEEYESGHCRIRITHAGQEVMSSWYISRGAATTHAEVMHTDLLHAGWGRARPG